jgi:hypothetical protein
MAEELSTITSIRTFDALASEPFDGRTWDEIVETPIAQAAYAANLGKGDICDMGRTILRLIATDLIASDVRENITAARDMFCVASDTASHTPQQNEDATKSLSRMSTLEDVDPETLMKIGAGLMMLAFKMPYHIDGHPTDQRGKDFFQAGASIYTYGRHTFFPRHAHAENAGAIAHSAQVAATLISEQWERMWY